MWHFLIPSSFWPGVLWLDRGRLQTSWKASEECRTTVKRLTTKVAQLRSGSGSKGKKESTAGKRKPVSFEGEGNWTREKAESLMPAGFFLCTEMIFRSGGEATTPG